MAKTALTASPALLKSIARQRGITQSELAEMVGRSQSQVSRTLAAKQLPPSAMAHKLCEVLLQPPCVSSVERVRRNADLLGAVAFVWDGSPEHATALATVIRSLRVLNPHPNSGEPEV